MDMDESYDQRISSLPAPVEDIQFNNNYNKNFLIIPNSKEIQDELSLLEKLSNDSFLYLNDYSNFFLIKNENLIKEIYNYCDKMGDEYCQFNINDKSSQNSKKFKSKKADFIMATERHITLMKKINKIFSQIFDLIKQNLEFLDKFLDKLIKYFYNFDNCNNNNNPIEDFLLEEFKNIINSWLLMKIDFGNFDFEEALSKADFEQNFKNFISDEFKKKNFILDIICPKGEISEQKELLKLKEQKEEI